MLTFLFVFFIGSCLLIVLGPYRICFQLTVISGEVSISLYIAAWKNLYCFGGERKKGEIYINGIFLKRSILYKKIVEGEENKIGINRKVKMSSRVKKKKRFRRFGVRIVPFAPVILKRILHNFKIEKLKIHTDFGAVDPALTGKVYGIVQSLQFLSGSVFRIEVKPNFLERVFEGKIMIVLSFILMRLLWNIFCSGIKVVWFYIKC